MTETKNNNWSFKEKYNQQNSYSIGRDASERQVSNKED